MDEKSSQDAEIPGKTVKSNENNNIEGYFASACNYLQVVISTT